MPYQRYARAVPTFTQELSTERAWPSRSIDQAPLWASVDLRDGNQSLVNPMGRQRKGLMFDLLVRMGFKEIEIGYPSSSDADFTFTRELILSDRIPDDVRISVFTPARPDLIDRTFEAIHGARQVTVHLCHATACLWRDVVFGLSLAEVEELAVTSATQVIQRADAMRGAKVRFEYTPETFNVTEPDFALRISNAVSSVWDASPDRPVTLNLPTTVETDSPNVFADQVEWMHRNLDRRESIILSVHPHNDRGTAVASAEMAVMAGADRIEGTLFGNGERTGNVCLATLALNLFSRGVDPQLDFSDIDDIRRTVEFCNQLPVHARHPYAGDLVYTAFSGTHQDAIAKGLAALTKRAEAAETVATELPWGVPYLPIDPLDVGRTYESVVRLNSQSGKGGIAHVLHKSYGLELPRWLRVEFGEQVQQIADRGGVELGAAQIWEAFNDEYLRFASPLLLLKEFQASDDRIDGILVRIDGQQASIGVTGSNPLAAFITALVDDGLQVELLEVVSQTVNAGHGLSRAAYAQIRLDGRILYGVGLDDEELGAELGAVLSAINRGHR
ncbi:MAG: 2-isopropylmalate synthase [Jatrophihabitantaceae bacterium]